MLDDIITPLPSDHPAVARLGKALRFYMEPGVMASLPAGVYRNVAGFTNEFHRNHPDIANVYMFRVSSSPNDRTAYEEMHDTYGISLRLALGRGAPALYVPKQNVTDNVAVIAFPLGRDDFGVSTQVDTPIVFTLGHRGLKSLLPVVRAVVLNAISANMVHSKPYTTLNHHEQVGALSVLRQRVAVLESENADLRDELATYHRSAADSASFVAAVDAALKAYSASEFAGALRACSAPGVNHGK